MIELGTVCLGWNNTFERDYDSLDISNFVERIRECVIRGNGEGNLSTMGGGGGFNF